MIAIALLLAASVAGPVRALTLEQFAVQGARFETMAAAAIASARQDAAPVASARPELGPADVFSGVPECATLDALTFRAFGLEEAVEQLQPCLSAALRRQGAAARVEAGFLSAPADGREGRMGLLVVADVAAGSRPHAALLDGLSRRGGRLLGHHARVLVQGDERPVKASALQATIDSCVLTAVVRPLRTGADFLKTYGGCLRRDSALKVAALEPAPGLAFSLVTQNDEAAAASYSGAVTVNAGRGPIEVLVLAKAAR